MTSRKWEYGVRIKAHDGTVFVFHGEEPLTKKQAQEYIVAKSDRLVRRRITEWERP